MRTIYIFPGADGYWQTMHKCDGKPDASVIELMGTHIIPTPISTRMNAADVISRLQPLNPGCLVELA